MSRKHTAATEQFNAKLTPSEAERLQKVNHELFGGDMNKSDLMRFMMKVALTALDSAKTEVQTVRTLKIGNKVIDLT